MSQWSQDTVCARILSDEFGVTDSGFYVDVGAADGVRINNTKLFADRPGWRGVCIEAHPDVVIELNANRASDRCEVVYAAVTDVRGLVMFRANSGYTCELSGIEQEYDARHIDRIQREQGALGGSSRLVAAPGRTLEAILDEMGNVPLTVDFMSIDVEGGELAVVRSLGKYNARVLTIEHNYADDTHVRVFLEKRGYTFMEKCGGDDVFALLINK
jgi:FkbM family methyltransferase